MAFNVTASLKAMESFLASLGYVRSTQIGEPKSPPVHDGLAAAVYMAGVSVAELTLSTTIEVHTVTIRLYRAMLAETPEQTETDMAQAVSNLGADLLGDYDLGATIRNVDAGGQYGAALSAAWGYVDLGGVIFRTVDVTVPLVVDDSATLAA